MKAYWGMEAWLHAFFGLGTRWRWVISFTPRPLYRQGKSPWYPLYRRLGGPQSRSEFGGEEKNSKTLSGLESRSDIRLASYVRVVCVYSSSSSSSWTSRISGLTKLALLGMHSEMFSSGRNLTETETFQKCNKEISVTWESVISKFQCVSHCEQSLAVSRVPL